MKQVNAVLALCAFHGAVSKTSAFGLNAPTTARTWDAPESSPFALRSATAPEASGEDLAFGDMDMFPVDLAFETIQGGETIRTYKIPTWAERLQYVIKTNGRPMKCMVSLWLGPLRQTHGMEINCMDGRITPYKATLKFRKGPPTFRITTSDELQLPIEAAVSVPSPEKSKLLAANTQAIWNTADKTLIQGGSVVGGHGAVRTFNIEAHVDAVQMVVWAIDTSKKSCKAKIEVLQGPNNKRQEYDLQLGGGSQPYHAVFETPGEGWMIRMYNKKFVEDGLFEVAVIPYDPPGGIATLGIGGVSRPQGNWWG